MSLDAFERSTLLAVLEDPPDSLAELRGALHATTPTGSSRLNSVEEKRDHRAVGWRQGGGLRLFLVLGGVTVIGPASMDIYLPGLPELARDFGATPSAAQVTLTTFLIGLALGQFLAGPLSDVHGRRRPLIAGMALFTVATLICSLAPNLYALAAMRLVQGAMAAAGLAIGRAIVRDLYSGAAAARYLSRLMLIVGLGPILAPVVGGQILRFSSWRGVFVALALLGLALTLMAARLLPETLSPGNRRAAGVGVTARTFAVLLANRSFVGFVLDRRILRRRPDRLHRRLVVRARGRLRRVTAALRAAVRDQRLLHGDRRADERTPAPDGDRRTASSGSGSTIMLVAAIGARRGGAVSRRRARRRDAAARAPVLQLELHPVEHARARPHGSPARRRHGGCACSASRSSRSRRSSHRSPASEATTRRADGGGDRHCAIGAVLAFVVLVPGASRHLVAGDVSEA